MTTVRLRYVDHFVCRHGHSRYYFRRGKGKRVILPGKPGTPEFMAAYQAALDKTPGKEEPRQRGETGTFNRLVRDYYGSPDFLSLNPKTRYHYRTTIERLLETENIGHRLVRQMTRQHIQHIMAKRASTPAAANDALKKIRILIHFDMDNGGRKDDPTLRLKKFPGGEHHTWTDEEIASYERRWPIETQERMAFALLLYTGQRVSDVVSMAWGDVDGIAIRVAQEKTGEKLWIPIHPALQHVLKKWPKTHIVLMPNRQGGAYTPSSLGQYMARRIEWSGLPDRCVAHGLRKAAARRLAEAGCSANEIKAITGHTTLNEVERYTKAAEQKKLAKAAINRLKKHDVNKKFPTR
jgi:enterobacteria phage integrase